MLNRNFLKFQDPRLSNYKFSLSLPGDNERCFGVDEQSNIWKGEGLAELSQKGLVVKKFSEKDIIVEEKEALIGYIRECPDNTFLAHSSYFFGALDCVEANGFKDEFHAIIYLHEIMAKTFPNTYPDVLGKESSDLQLNLVNMKEIYVQGLEAKIGYIQQISDDLWMADSLYHPANMSGLKVVGFLSEFYASRYLFQIAEAFFPSIVDEIPELPWKYMNGKIVK